MSNISRYRLSSNATELTADTINIIMDIIYIIHTHTHCEESDGVCF